MRCHYSSLVLFSLLVAGSGLQAEDRYTAGFYTRGVETTDDLDREDAVFSPDYIALSTKWALVPRITLSTTYENNPTLNANRREEATAIYLVPGALLMYGRRHHNHVYLDSGLILPLYTETDGISEKPSLMLVLGGLFQTEKSSLHARAGYRRIENVDTGAGARIIQDDYTADVALEHTVSQKTSLGLLGNVGRFEFNEAGYTDYWRYYGAGRVYYRVFPRSQLFLQAGLGQDRLDKQEDSLGNATFHDLSVGVRGLRSTKSSIGGRLGYRWRETRKAGGHYNVEHYIGSLEAKTSPFGVTVFTADLQADIRPAIASSGLATVDQRGTLGLSRRIYTESVRGHAAVFLGQMDYYGTPQASADGEVDAYYDGRRDVYWGYRVGLDWWTRHNLSLGVFYSYFEQNAARNGLHAIRDVASYDNGRWGGRMSWNF